MATRDPRNKTNEGQSTLIGLDPESQNIAGVVAHLEVDPEPIVLYVVYPTADWESAVLYEIM